VGGLQVNGKVTEKDTQIEKALRNSGLEVKHTSYEGRGRRYSVYRSSTHQGLTLCISGDYFDDHAAEELVDSVVNDADIPGRLDRSEQDPIRLGYEGVVRDAACRD